MKKVDSMFNKEKVSKLRSMEEISKMYYKLKVKNRSEFTRWKAAIRDAKIRALEWVLSKEEEIEVGVK